MIETTRTRKNRSYELSPYDVTWPDQYQKLAEWLREVFGELATDIQHIGSTSIPGMLAKPVIDVLVLVSDLSTVKDLYPAFSSAKYTCRGDYTQQSEEYFTYDSDDGKRLYNVHVMQFDNPKIQDKLAFRDYLRTHPQARQAYISIKEKLMQTYGKDDYNSYDWQKSELMQQIIQDAKEWSKHKS